MSFRLWTIFYVFAVFAAALATFGGTGIVCAAVVLAFWLLLFSGSKPAWKRLKLLIAFFVAGGLFVLLLPAISNVRHTVRRLQCANQLKQLVLSIHQYHDKHGTFPPAVVNDVKDQPLFSWRVLILPFIERKDLFDQFDRTKAWDDTSNYNVSWTPLDIFNCQSSAYYAIIGSNTAWPGSRGRSFKEFTDGTRYTIVLIEAPRQSIHWAEPRELSFEEAVALLSSPSQQAGHRIDNGFFYKPSYGRYVAFADGHAALLQRPLESSLAAALLTVDGGEEIDTNALLQANEPQLDYRKCYSFAVFVLLSLAPSMQLLRGSLAYNEPCATLSESSF